MVVARDYKFMCSSLGQELIEKDIQEQGLTRVVVAACSPHLHEPTFRTACASAGLNPYLCEMASIREHVSWVHTDKDAATAKAKAMVSGGVERVRHHEPLEPMHVPIHATTLVVGGGIAGIQAALEIADAGYPVYLVEREPSHRRAHGPVRQDLPDPRLLGLHPDAEDGRRPATTPTSRC